MKKLFSIFPLITLFCSLFVFPVNGQTGIQIFNLINNQAVQGIQAIRGTSFGDGFSSYMVQFSTISNPDNWFNILESTEPVNNDVLAEWDTTIISDGEYHIRLVVLFENGDLIIDEIQNLRVRNYTAIETSTPTITPTHNPEATATTTIAPTQNYSTATPLPPNSAIFTGDDMSKAFLYGAIGSVIFLIPILLFQSIKQNRKY